MESGLRDLGYVPGTNVVIDCRSADGRYERLPTAAAELVKLNVDVIVAASQPTAQAAHDATQTIPIVMIASGDPVSAGLVKSLGHPGGNVTGLTYYATELTAKRLELLRDAVPSVTKIGVLANPVVAYLPFENDTLKAAAALGIGVVIHHVSEAPDIDVAIEEICLGRCSDGHSWCGELIVWRAALSTHPKCRPDGGLHIQFSSA